MQNALWPLPSPRLTGKFFATASLFIAFLLFFPGSVEARKKKIIDLSPYNNTELIEMLKRDSIELRKVVVSELGRRGAIEAAPELRQLLTDSEQPQDVRLQSMQSLHSIQLEKANTTLQELVQNDEEDKHVRWQSARLLSQTPTAEAFGVLRGVYVSSTDTVLQNIILKGLGSFTDEGSLDFLVTMVQRLDPKSFTWRIAIAALVKRESPKVASPLLAAYPDLLSAAERQGVLNSLLRQELPKDAAATIAQLLASEREAEQQELMLKLLLTQNNPAALPVVNPLLKSSDSAVVSIVAQNLRNYGDETSLEAILDIMMAQTAPLPVRLDLTTALQRIAPHHAIPFIAQLLPELVRKTAAKELSESITRTFLRYLGQSRDPAQVPVLLSLDLLGNESLEVRIEAIQALGLLSGELARDELLKLLKDSNARIRWTAAAALDRYDSGDVADALVELLKDSNVDVVLASLRSLHSVVKSAELLELRQTLESHPAPAVREAARTLLCPKP